MLEGRQNVLQVKFGDFLLIVTAENKSASS